VLPDGEQPELENRKQTKLGRNPLSVLTILRHRGETSSLMQRIKQESSFMGGSLACLLHHRSPEFSIALKSRRLISGTSQRGRSWDSISGIGLANWK
jgi:hypothetical protein